MSPAPAVSGGGVGGLVGAALLDVAVADPRRGHLLALFGAAADRVERALWRDDRRVGAAYTALLVGVPTLLAGLLDRRAGAGRGALLAAVTWAALGGRLLGREALGVGAAVAAADLPTAGRRVPALVGRDPSGLDGPELCRAAVESVAENSADSVVVPLVWGALAGPAGVVAHRCANTLDAMVGHRSPRHLRFGEASSWLDDLLARLPAGLAALLAALLAPAAGGSPARVAVRDGANSPSPNAGRSEAAFAGALGVRLGGVNRYGDRVEVRGPLGDGPPPVPGHVVCAVRLSRAVTAAALGLAVLVARRRP